MSTVVLQVGQGGNQYGLAFFDAMSGSLPLDFFEESEKRVRTARAVLVDMEPKVVAAVAKKAASSGVWKYGSQKFSLHGGSGNNWAAGYCSNGTAHEGAILELVRTKIEACDDFGGFLAIQSLAGGTGAGLGSYLLEVLKDEYPSACIMSHCIWPYQSGEVVVQNYNVLLTLAKLQDTADGIITVENEALASMCKRSLGIERPSFADMNRVGAHSLASVLLPSYWRPVEGTLSSGPPHRVRLLSGILYALCAQPGYRMLSLHSNPRVRAECLDFTTFTWASQLRQLKRSVYPVELVGEEANKSAVVRKPKSLASLLTLRGKAGQAADVRMFSEPSLYAPWCIDPLNVSYHEQLGTRELVAGVITNCQSAIRPASEVLSRAYAMYFTKAYLHQYMQHGLDGSFFESSFSCLEDVLQRYLSL